MKTPNFTLKLLFLIAFVPFVNTVIAQNLSKSTLIKPWKLEKYYEDGEYYPPEEHETKDYIQFNEDMTFTALMEGELYKGSWMLNINGGYIEIKYSTGEIDKLRVKWSSDYSLVVIFDADYYRYTEVHYNTIKP